MSIWTRPALTCNMRQSRATQRDEQIQIGITSARVGQDATRIDLQRAAEGAAQRDDRMQTTLEVVRTDQQIAMQQLPQLSGDFGSRVDALVALVRETRDLSSIIVSRADLIVQRMALPLESGILMHLPGGLIIAPSDDEALSAAIWQSGGRLEPGALQSDCRVGRGGRFCHRHRS